MTVRNLLPAVAMFAVFLPAIALASGSNETVQRSVVAEGPVTMTLKVDKSVARVAEPIELHVEIDAPRGTQVELPKVSSDLGAFDVQNSKQAKEIPAADAGDTCSWVLQITLDTIKTGEVTIPPLEVQYATDPKSTVFKTLRSKPIRVRIASVLENRSDPAEFHDIKGTVDMAVPEPKSLAWIGWTAGGVGTLTAIALIAFVVARRKRRPSPAEWALAAIEDLERHQLLNATDAEAFYNEAVDIVREFFELQFHVPALSRTTREFLSQAANEVGLDKTARQRLAWLASIADEIKFARRDVGEQQLRQALAQAKAFIAECEQHYQTRQQEAA